MLRPSPLDDPRTAAVAWKRYRRLVGGMAGFALVAVVASLGWLRWSMGTGLSIHMMIATALGVGASVMLSALLMGLVFLSSGTGHDEAVEDPLEGEGVQP
ncbi:MAG: hypothetical protein RLZZ58_644 [Pseudomonadota bacterium]|jgi:hypothetical protein